MIYILIILLALFPLGCTTTKYIPALQIKEVEKIVVEKNDVYIKDSIYIHKRADTVFYERWSTKYIDRLKTDSIIIRDSIPIPYEVIKEVKVQRELTLWQNIRIKAGGWLLAFAGIFLLYKLKFK